MSARFYVNATGEPWNPGPRITTLGGQNASRINVLEDWSIAEIEAAFGVSAPDWSEPPAGQMVDIETVTPDGMGGLVFLRTFKPKPNPNLATILATITAAAIRDKRQNALDLLIEVFEGQFTREEIIAKVTALNATQRDQLAAAVNTPLTGANLIP